mgnify:CR=1 FL=1
MSDNKNLPLSFAMKFNTQDAESGEELQSQRDNPFCIALMGGVSARHGDTEKTPMGDREFIEIDRYNYDDILASKNLRLSLSLDQGNDVTIDVPLNSLKDFHPDKLYKNVTAFDQLRDLRERLNNPATFKQAMQEIGLKEDEVFAQQTSVQSEKMQPESNTELSQESTTGSLLDTILGGGEVTASHRAEAERATVQESKTLVDGFIQQLVANKSKTLTRYARQNDMVATIDESISFQMRSLIHHPKFQALEAAWRALHFLVKRIPVNKKVKLYLIDINRSDLASDLNVDDVTQSHLYKKFCDNSAGDINWNLIIADYQFGADIDDILELSQMGVIAHQAGAQFIAGANESLVGCRSFAETPKVDHWQLEDSQTVIEAWTLLRKSQVALSISLALPRFILRAPYGKKSTPVKSFAFEEMSQSPEHEAYLWGNSAFLKAEQISRAFIQSGWNLQYNKVMDTEDLPVHYYEKAGQTIVKPCAEIPLTDTGASKMIAQGLIPLWSVKNSDRVHSGDFHSIGL